MRTVFISVFVSFWMIGCVSQGARSHVEELNNALIGQFPHDANNGKGLRCAQKNATSCLAIYDSGCAIEYQLDNSTGRIIGWQYVGDPRRCWVLSGA
jgi:hypothetical protein